MQKKIIILVLLLAISCQRLPDSKGKYNQIIIISSNEDKKIYYNQVEKLFFRGDTYPFKGKDI